MPRKEKTGVVVSNKNDKTVVVKVPEYRPHPKYKKIIEQNKNYVAADYTNECNEGDRVRIRKLEQSAKQNVGAWWKSLKKLDSFFRSRTHQI